MTDQAEQRDVRLLPSGPQDQKCGVYAFAVDGEPKSPEPREVDVVFVHGLTGDKLKTWGGSEDQKTHLVSDCWPADLARALRGRARIWSVGYEAPLFDSALGTSPQTPGQEAGDALAAMLRAGIGQRPIIFVAHSLGGLLVKAVLHCSFGERDPGKQAVAKRTTAVCFLGTPHSGSDHARWRHLIPQVAKWAAGGWGLAALTLLGASGIGGGVGAVSLFNASLPITVAGVVAGVLVLPLAILLKHLLRPGRHVLRLDPDNAELFALTDGYREVLQSQWLATDAFYEAKPTWCLWIVPRPSADPGVTHCKPLAINANHIHMCKKPNVVQVMEKITKHVEQARRGIDAAVFDKALVDLCDFNKYPAVAALTSKDANHTRSFFAEFKKASVSDGTRARAEEALRTCLRALIGEKEFRPTAFELGLCRGSRFDVDKFVWQMWHEHVVADILRDLRCGATEIQQKWPMEFAEAEKCKADPPPSLIPFYRSLRTIEHICIGDLADPTRHKLDRELLLEAIDKAEQCLAQWCPQMQWQLNDGTNYEMDQDGSTRRLLVRMRCALKAMASAVEFIEQNERTHQNANQHGADLQAQEVRFNAALGGFRRALGLPVPEQSGSEGLAPG